MHVFSAPHMELSGKFWAPHSPPKSQIFPLTHPHIRVSIKFGMFGVQASACIPNPQGWQHPGIKVGGPPPCSHPIYPLYPPCAPAVPPPHQLSHASYPQTQRVPPCTFIFPNQRALPCRFMFPSHLAPSRASPCHSSSLLLSPAQQRCTHVPLYVRSPIRTPLHLYLSPNPLPQPPTPHQLATIPHSRYDSPFTLFPQNGTFP
jgi:hypothetical protein